MLSTTDHSAYADISNGPTPPFRPMTDRDRAKWDERYRLGQGPRGDRANRRLEPYAAFVGMLADRCTSAGVTPCALDVACGLGGTARWLARRGWHVTAVDVSREAIAQARDLSAAETVAGRISFLAVDLNRGERSWRPRPGGADLVTCFYYLNRELWPALAAAVRPGGLFIHETFNLHQQLHRRPSSVDKLLRPGELLAEVRGWGWAVLDYRSFGPDAERPFDAIVAKRPHPIADNPISLPESEQP